MMKIVETTRELSDYREGIEITIDGESVFDVHDGEPEDNSLSRNFSSCRGVMKLLRKMYALGLQNKNVEFLEETEEELD